MLKKRVALIDSLIPKSVLNDIVEKFQSEASDSHQFIVGTTKIMGTGLTLTAASWMGILEPEWFAQDLTQARKRVDRIGQTKETTSILFTNSKCSAESQIIKRQRRRLNLNKDMLDINNFDATSLNRGTGEGPIFESRPGEVEPALEETNDADAYVIV